MGIQDTIFENLNIDLNDGTLYILLWAICGGLILGIVLSLLQRIGTGSFIKALTEKGASTPESAMTVDELMNGMGKQITKLLIRNGNSSIHRYVLCANKDETSDKKLSAQKKYYLPEENRTSAEVRYPVQKRPVFTLVMGTVGIILIGVFLTFVTPRLLSMLDDFIGNIKG